MTNISVGLIERNGGFCTGGELKGCVNGMDFMLLYRVFEGLGYLMVVVSLAHYLATPTDRGFWTLRVPGCRTRDWRSAAGYSLGGRCLQVSGSVLKFEKRECKE